MSLYIVVTLRLTLLAAVVSGCQMPEFLAPGSGCGWRYMLESRTDTVWAYPKHPDLADHPPIPIPVTQKVKTDSAWVCR